VIACDAHPQFLTSQLADAWASEFDAKVVRVQHHAAHLASVMIEQGLQRAVGIVLDGYGYGTDGGAWGGEILVADDCVVTRAGSLRPVLLPGGDLAARTPLRMAASFLLSSGRDPSETIDVLVERGMTRTEAELLLTQLLRGIHAPLTTSAGRFLDAVAAWLGVCTRRTYEGEPAMRLEAAAAGGRASEIPVGFVDIDGVPRLDVAALFDRLVRLAETESARDVAATAQECLARGAAELGVRMAHERDIPSICLSGGVAYNDHIATRIREAVEAEGYTFHMNEAVPCGDGGVSLGQAAYAGLGYRFLD